jgi:hypothetical protein
MWRPGRVHQANARPDGKPSAVFGFSFRACNGFIVSLPRPRVGLSHAIFRTLLRASRDQGAVRKKLWMEKNLYESDTADVPNSRFKTSLSTDGRATGFAGCL